MLDYSEKNFEQTIEETLLAGGPDGPAGGTLREGTGSYGDFIPGGYLCRSPEDYDRVRHLIPRDVLDFIYATQPKEWDKLKKTCGPDAKDRLLNRLSSQIAARGTLDVLRKGIKSDGCHFDLAYFKPSSGLNPATQRLHHANLFSVVRQLHYSLKDEKSLDLAMFLNGLPIFTAELKNPFTGQTVSGAIYQYRQDRNPKEPLFVFGRCLAHFAVDPDLVYVTTRLEGLKTVFLPFNQGRDGGAGNPTSWRGFATAYLWEQIWARDSVLDLIQQFIQMVEEEDEKGRKTGEHSLIFPRFHQLDAVRRLVHDAQEKGPGQAYLIQHSAGSGKSNSIAWLAHQLSVLHDASDNRVFHSIIVVTDRRVLDRQLQRNVRQFEQVVGVVENIDKTSRQLREALEDGKTIIVTTLQKFPVIAQEISELTGQRFAVIVDEAHSSQGGESTKSLKSVLAAGNLEDAEREDDEASRDALNDRVLEEIKKRGRLPNVSYFAFTATPKPETMELFGCRQLDGRFAPFSLYSMRQAIEEHFILDVLEHYATYQAYWNLLKTVQDDPRYEREKAKSLLKSFVELHEHAIENKLQIMVEHFVSQVKDRIGGRAKAMIVTRSRLHAVRYKLAIDEYLKDRGYGFRVLVAFSGTVRDGGREYTEANMNGFPETQTADRFKKDEYRILIAANKFQVGFDQPLLHTMYVDKRLSGVNAVQTLSRLNRVYSGKEETMVLDFANEAEDIQASFQPYYDRTILSQATDPNLLYDLETRLESFHLHGQDDIDRFARVYFGPKPTQDKLHAALQAVVDRFVAANEEDRAGFRGTLKDFIRLYAFLSQILPFADVGLQKLYEFGRFLLRKLPPSRERLPVEIQHQIDIESYRISKTGNSKIKLEPGLGKLKPIEPKNGHVPVPDEIEPLSAIIKELNEHFGTDFSEEDQVFIQQLEAQLGANPGLEASVRVNTPENARLTFDHVVSDVLQDMIDSNFKFYKQVTDNPEFAKMFLSWLFERYLSQRSRKANGQ